jgi:hypothetical protein
MDYASGWRAGWLDASIGHRSDYAALDPDPYGKGYRAGQYAYGRGEPLDSPARLG